VVCEILSVNLVYNRYVSTAIGNLLSQMISVGEIASVQEARELIKVSFDIKEV
jgi:hypothetical protein